MNETERVFWLKLAVSMGLGWGLWHIRRAWCPVRLCPPAPILANFSLGVNPRWLHRSMLGSLILIAVAPQPQLPIAALVLLVALSSLADWTRFRPWVYQSSFVLLAIGLACAGLSSWEQALDVCRLITAAIYFWAGVMKGNAVFVDLIFPWVVEPIRRRLPASCRPLLHRFGYAVPFLEAGIGLGLLFPAGRPWALAGAAAMHGLILFCFSPLGHRTHPEVAPWNASMLLSALICFLATPGVGPAQILLGQESWFHYGILLLFAGLPALGLVNLLDPVFSHGHMAGKHVFGAIAMSRRLYHKLPRAIRSRCWRNGEPQGQIYTLDISEWYLHELRTPPPQQERLLRSIARSLASYGAGPEDISLTVFRMPGFLTTTLPQKTYAGAELLSEPRLPAGLPL